MEDEKQKIPIILARDSEGRPLSIKFPDTPIVVGKNFLYFLEQRLGKQLIVSPYMFKTLLATIEAVYAPKMDEDGQPLYNTRDAADLYSSVLEEWRTLIRWLSEPLHDNANEYSLEVQTQHEQDLTAHLKEHQQIFLDIENLQL